MRDVSPTLVDAILADGIKMTARLTTYRSRVYFKDTELEVDDAVDTLNMFTLDNPMPEAMAWNSSLEQFITAFPNLDGELCLSKVKSPSVVVVDYLGNPIQIGLISRLSIYENFVYCHVDGNQWVKITIDIDAFDADDTACVHSLEEITAISDANLANVEGAIYATSENKGVLFTIDEGGVGICQWDNSEDLYIGGTFNKCPGRLFKPTQAYTQADVSITHFSSAVEVDGKMFCYFSQYNGEVKVVTFENNTWSDFFTAIPSDLSFFKIGNAFTHNGAIYLCGAFTRAEEFSSDDVRTLFTKSIDGISFSLDKRTLSSLVPYRFLAAFGDEGLYGDQLIMFSSGKRYFESPAIYQVVGEEADAVNVDCKVISGSAISSFSVRVKAGREEYFVNPLVSVGAFSKLEIGVETTEGVEWIKYHDVVIETINKGIRDGSRSMSMTLLADAKWHTSEMTYPFYMEEQGKQSVYTDAKEFDTLYKLSSESGVEWSFMADFWDSDGPGSAFGPRGHAASTTTTHMTVDLSTLFVTYPTFGDLSEYEVKVFGWSRAGKQDTNPNTPDPTPTNTPNDDFFLVLELESSSGIKSTYVATGAELSSDHSNPPQTYFTEGIRAGSYPVIFTIPNPGEGTKIIKAGVNVVSGSGQTIYSLERIEIPELTVVYKNETTLQNSSFQIQEATATWPLVDTLTLQVDEDNAVDGNQVSTTATLKDGYCYAIVIQGDVVFERNGYQWIQDGEFYCRVDLTDNPFYTPVWNRLFPPGEGPIANPSVIVNSPDFPYFSSGDIEKQSVQTKTKPTTNHVYTFKHEDTRLKSSKVKNNQIPYVYSDGTPIDISLYLAGTSTISNIQGGEFTVYIFESPVPFNEFRFYGGVLGIGSMFQTVEQFIDTPPTYGTYTPFTPSVIDGSVVSSFTAEANYSGSYGFVGEGAILDINCGYRIENTSLIPIYIICNFEIEWISPMIGVPGHYGVGFLFRNVNTAVETIIWNGIGFNPGFPDHEQEGTIEIPAGHVMECRIMIKNTAFSMMPVQTWDANMRLEISSATDVPVNPQVPVPPSFILKMPIGGILGDAGINKTMKTMQKGVPQVLFSTQPYSAYNFESTARMSVVGSRSYAGIIGLGKDENNYIVGYFRMGFIGIAKVRDGITTIIHEQNIAALIESDKLYDLRFSHRDGLFGIDIKTVSEFWSYRGVTEGLSSNGFSYRWTEADGPLSVDDDIFHVGIYGYINPPKFRTVGHSSSSQFIPILPGDINPAHGNSDVLNRWVADVGYQVDIQGVIYNYANVNRLLFDGDHPYMGPYQIRSTEEWNEPFNNDKNGKTYQGGKAVEFTFFQWLNGTSHALDYAGSLVASAGGYSWELDESQWKVWITTGGQVVWLRNRSRHYSENIPDNYVDGYDRFFITDGLQNVTVEGEVEYNHPYGTFVYLHSGDYVLVEAFSAISGDADNSVASLIQKISRISGTNASFIGDNIIPVTELDEDESVEI